ncbi:hypothetical protein [Undibacterium sp. Ji49W]|uniref:hypothetical protein n=1 Tax=Undibacterium sp. Ji49W TaxID=3413040 RepID=UPI003BF0D28D
MKFNYSFSLTPPAQPSRKLVEYSYSEFLIDLPSHWKLVPNSQHNTLTFQSDIEGASIIISVDFYDVPSSKAQTVAEKCIDGRLSAHEQQFPARVEVLQRSIRMHSGGTGLEMSYAAEVAGDHMFMYLGYVTSRKILNLTMVCKPERSKASELFNVTIGNFRPKLP